MSLESLRIFWRLLLQPLGPGLGLPSPHVRGGGENGARASLSVMGPQVLFLACVLESQLELQPLEHLQSAWRSVPSL